MTRVAMVTGASSGIGEAYADRLAADGYDLVIVARREDRLRELGARLEATHGVTVKAVQADLGHPNDVQRVCDEIDTAQLDILVNNAGLAHYMPFAELPPLQAQELVDVNALAPVLLTRAAVTGMLARERGSIINVASLLAFSGPVDAPTFRSGLSTRPPSRSWSPLARFWLVRCLPEACRSRSSALGSSGLSSIPGRAWT